MNKLILWSAILAMTFPGSLFADGHVSSAPGDAKVYFITPQDGDVITGKVEVKFGLSGMGVAPAGVKKEKTGHHHILINTDASSIDMSRPLPATDKIKHFGGGQTEAELDLPPGKHTLQLVLGNYAHIPHDKPVVSEKITITVEKKKKGGFSSFY